MADIVIVGNGPAGISAALYAVRAGLKTLVVGKDTGSLKKADKIENYYGFPQPVSGPELVENGIAQAKRLGVQLENDEITGIGYDGQYLLSGKNSAYAAPVVILATGSSRAKPKIQGLETFEGHGVSYCATCDAFFYKGKDVAVLGNGEYALHEAKELLPVAGSVTLLTNGQTPPENLPEGLKINTQKIAQLSGNDVLGHAEFEDGSSLALSGLFVAIGVAGSADLARKLGAMTEGSKIVVDANMATNLPGLYAAGDCTGGLLQIAKAVYEGAKAGTEAVKYIRKSS